MTTFSLTDWLTLEVYRTLLVFVRISAAFLLMPGFGEPTVPTRIRILAGLAVAVAVAPAVAGMPDTVPTTWALIVAVAAEAVCGALLGTLARTLISAVLMAGQVIGQNIALSNIFATGVAVDQSATLGATLYAGIVAVMFAANGHHAVLRALVESYGLLPPGHFPEMAASAHAVVMAGLRSFRLGGELALPLLLLALVFHVALGAVNRAMPAMPVFMIANPALVMVGLYVLAATVPGIFDVGTAWWTALPSLLR
jgi:flagellar biosynthetic protein FliR